MTADPLLRWYRHRRFAWLFLSLVLTLGVQPIAGPRLLGGAVIEVLLAINLVAAIASVRHDRSIRVLLMLGVCFAVTRGIAGLMGHGALLSLSQVLWASAGVVAIVAAVRYALRARRVDVEHIFAALDAYLLAGVMIGVVCWVLDELAPGSFKGMAGGSLTLPEGIYFSFVTLATLGYGDIVPVSDVARSLAILAAVSGQMYLTVLVAWLVSLYAKARGD